VQQTAGGIGYVEQSYADNNHLMHGMMQNKDGKFVKASAETVSAAGAETAAKMNGNLLAADLWNQPGEKAYPIASFTYLIIYKDLRNAPNRESAEALVRFLWWAVHDGQKNAMELGYAPLAPEVQRNVEEALRQITFKGEALKVGAGA
jgi:phosphate transport system substrate-binding protein